MNIYRVILFDINGTLIDYWGARNKALKEVVKQTIHELNQNSYKEKNVNVNVKRIKEIENELRMEGFSLDKLRIIRFSRWIYENFGIQMNTDVNINLSIKLNKKYTKLTDKFITLFPDVKETLIKLNNEGIKLVIISNGPANNQMRRLKKCGILDYFSKFIFSEEIGISKPNKLFYDYIFENIISDREHSLVVGDDVIEDVQGAGNYGLDAVWVNRNGRTNKLNEIDTKWYEILNLDGLLNIVLSKNNN